MAPRAMHSPALRVRSGTPKRCARSAAHLTATRSSASSPTLLEGVGQLVALPSWTELSDLKHAGPSHRHHRGGETSQWLLIEMANAMT